MGCEKSMKLHQKKEKSMKYWWIDQIAYSHFLIENWKAKTLGTITAYINIEKLNERGKKRLNAKLERHLARPHTLLYEVHAFKKNSSDGTWVPIGFFKKISNLDIYIYIYIYKIGFKTHIIYYMLIIFYHSLFNLQKTTN